MELFIEPFMWFGTFAMVFWAVEFIYKLMKFVVRLIATRFFGWRPKIYNKALASMVVQEGITQIRHELAEAGVEYNENQWETIENYGEWLIEAYTVQFALGRK